MGRYIVKPDKDKDEWVLWSTIVDNAVSPVLMRDEMAEWLLDDGIEELKERIARQLSRPYREFQLGSTDTVANVEHDDFEGAYKLHVNDLTRFVRAQESGDTDTLNEVLKVIDYD